MSANCRETIELLAGFLDGSLSAAEDAALRGHFVDCPKCVEFLESYRETSRVVREATEVEIPDDVLSRLLTFLEARKPD